MNFRARASVAFLFSFGAFSAFGQGDASSTPPTVSTQPEPIIMVIPVEISNDALQSGCWAQFYDEREFKGNMVTIVGPIRFDSFDKGNGRKMKQSIDSLVTGSKATLHFYEHQMFKDRTAEIGPNSRERGLFKKLGLGGEIQSLTLECGS